MTAAIVLAQAGLKVWVFEQADLLGGGTRTAELTLPGYLHDVCSAVHPLGVGSPILKTFPLADYGLEWIHPPQPLAHPFDDGSALLLHRSVAETARVLGEDGAAWRRVMDPLVDHWEQLIAEFLQPLIHVPKHPLRLSAFGLQGLWPAGSYARANFATGRARTLFAGLAAHSILPLSKMVSTAFGLVLGMLAHGVGWPVPRGGSQSIANALCAYLRSLGGEVITGRPVRNIDELRNQFPGVRAILCDVTPRQLLTIAGDRFTAPFRRALERYRYGPGVYKVDWALRDPIPWKAAECSLAATVHIGGSLAEIVHSESAAWDGQHVDRPFIILAQPSLFDSTRAPAGNHTAWAYCHVPNGSSEPMIDQIENQIERFAPGFRETVLARHIFTPASFEQYNPNLVGGDINGGAGDLSQLLVRPTTRLYRTPAKDIYLCSASTPPGGGVHGMCGYGAAKAVLHDHFGRPR